MIQNKLLDTKWNLPTNSIASSNQLSIYHLFPSFVIFPCFTFFIFDPWQRGFDITWLV